MYSMELRMRTRSQINKSKTKIKCVIDVSNIEHMYRTKNTCYFMISTSNGEFVQKQKQTRSISHQQSISNHHKRDTISTCPSDIASINNSDMPMLNVSVINKKKVF